VRLGITWKGLEPGTAGANNPSICRRGAPGDPHQFNQAIFDAYLSNVAKTVALLGQYHIYTLLDMHQDVYNERFDGEGAPSWAVCTNGARSTDTPGRWSQNYATAPADNAYRHFWTNDVVGNLQGEYDRVWAGVASYFRTNPWILGYDPFNEPFSKALVTHGDEQFDGQLECFYTGKSLVGRPTHGAPPITCPSHDPALGVLPTILTADPTHLVFYEPNIFGERGRPNFIGPMQLPNLVFNVHVYCSYRSGKTGNRPTSPPVPLRECARSESAPRAGASWHRSPSRMVPPGSSASLERPRIRHCSTGSPVRPTESWSGGHTGHGSTTAIRPGAPNEALLAPDGRLRSTARVLVRTYPQAIAGRPTSLSFDPASGAFHLAYVPDHAIHAPTVIFVPTQIHYPDRVLRAGRRGHGDLQAGKPVPPSRQRPHWHLGAGHGHLGSVCLSGRTTQPAPFFGLSARAANAAAGPAGEASG